MAEADLEIGLHKDGFKYRVDLRFSSPETEAAKIDDFQQGEARFDEADADPLTMFRALATSAEYGQRLARWILHDEELNRTFTRALATAETRGWTVNLRILIGPSAPELHTLNWERLELPGDPRMQLALRADRVHLSRYLFSHDWRTADRRAAGPLRGLLAVANPRGLPAGLAPVDLSDAIAACAQVRDVQMVTLSNPGEASFARIQEELQQEPGIDFLFLVCHGRFAEGETWLYLEDEAGNVSRHSGTDIAKMIADLPETGCPRPRLVLFLSCDSSGRAIASEKEEQVGAIAPRLAAAGVPAVLGVQGSVHQEAAARFLRAFLAKTVESGDLGRALAEARQQLSRAPDDWWRFVLYSRLRNGQLWYTPGAATESDQNFWIAVRSHVDAAQKGPRQQRGRVGCVPILGFELTERLLGGTREVAKRWARENAIPAASPEAENLPQLAGYLAYMRGRDAMLNGEHGLIPFLRAELVRRYEKEIAAVLVKRGERDVTAGHMREGRWPVHELVSAVGRYAMEMDVNNPHRILARLRLPLYVTASPLSLMSDALEMELENETHQEGKKVRVTTAAYPWRRLERRAFPFDDLEEWPLQLPSYDHWELDPERPLVYHLFGVMSELSSMAITEDDFIDYLVNFLYGADDIRVAGGEGAEPGSHAITKTLRTGYRFPTFLLSALRSSAVFLVGFSFDDWSFRVLVRSLRSLGTFVAAEGVQHVAVQVHPDENRGMSPEATERYLKKYFETAKIGLFLGSAREFTAQLADKCPAPVGQDR